MGIDFRGSTYRRDVSMGKRTVKEGEAVAKWDRVGVHTQVVGPALVYLFFSTVQFLDCFTAGPNEYLIVTRKDGSVEHNRGPLSMFKNPVFHTSISVHTCFTLLSASEVIVVNRDTSQRALAAPSGMVTPVSVLDPAKAQVKVLDARDEKHEGIRRLIVSGPATFFPQVGDSVVQFSWHGRRDALKTTQQPSMNTSEFAMHRDALTFIVLHTNNRQWKIDSPFVVSDTLRGSLGLTFTFALTEVGRMLDSTGDLIGDMRDALVNDLALLVEICREGGGGAGVVAGGDSVGAGDGVARGEGLSSAMVQVLSNLDRYPTLLKRAGEMGVELRGAMVRGFLVDQDLAQEGKETRNVQSKITRAALVEAAAARSELEQLQARRGRVDAEQLLEGAQLASQQAAAGARLQAKRAALEAESEYRQAEQTSALALRASLHGGEMERVQARNDEVMRVLGGLKEMGVDLNKLFTRPVHMMPSAGAGAKCGGGAAAGGVGALEQGLVPLFSFPEEKEG
ncbi:hypothetical protein B484DRAFT_396556 [Ochromonadaceae sp. CCMP2298]|nr:hypothetical protein B484DRAFT_396556 [Ochromonadaceae sp. CCMP2298]